MKKYVLWSVLCLVVLTGFGCAASREAGGLSGPEFPTIKEIQKVKIKAKKETQTVDVFQESAVSLSGWKVLDGAPTRIDETPSSSGENPLMSEVFSIVSKRPGALHVQEMDCIAREYARLAADEVKPSLAWTRFVHARCGAVLSNRVATYFLSADGVEGKSDAEVLEYWASQKEGLTEALQRVLNKQKGDSLVGVGMVRKGDKSFVSVVAGERALELEPMSMMAKGGQVLLKGKMYGEVGELLVSAGVGDFGARLCRSTGRETLPRFEFVCEVDTKDAISFVEISRVKPGRILGDIVATQLFFPQGEAYNAAPRYPALDRVTVDKSKNEKEQFLAILNQLRSTAGMEPATLETAQSQDVADLLPLFAAARLGEVKDAEKTVDTITLGLMAGWHVKGMVHDAGFYSFGSRALKVEKGVVDLFKEQLHQPSFRHVFFSPVRKRVAVGLHSDSKKRYTMAMAYSYSVLDMKGNNRDAVKVRDKLQDQFAWVKEEKHYYPELQIMMLREANALEKGDRSPKDVLNRMLQKSSRITGASVQGYLVQANSLEDVKFPGNLLNGTERVELSVGYYQHEDSAWGTYIVFVIIVANDGYI